ncbi:MAG: helix-turn-helix transcriptional regulator [Clostridia bacterium]|nr:helix-turn-helix transcriptional regulator [Clostridia bacterium]
MSIDYKLIGSRIKQKRKEAGKTQEWLAEQLDVTVGYVSQVERGVTKISLDTLANISGCLATDIAFFVSGSATADTAYMQSELQKNFDCLTPKQKRLLLDCMELVIESNYE